MKIYSFYLKIFIHFSSVIVRFNYNLHYSKIFETGISGKRHFRSAQLDGIEFDELISIDDFGNKKAQVVNVLVDERRTCPLCGRPLNKGEQAVLLKSEQNSWLVHLNCSDNIYEILRNLRNYSEIMPYEKKQWKIILNESGNSNKRKLPLIDSSWEYFPLYDYFLKQKSKLIRVSFNKMESVLGFKLQKVQKSYEVITAIPEGNHLELMDAWEKAGYRVKPMKHPERFNGTVTFERKEPNDKEVINHPLMKSEVISDVQKDLNRLIQTLIDSRK